MAMLLIYILSMQGLKIKAKLLLLMHFSML